MPCNSVKGEQIFGERSMKLHLTLDIDGSEVEHTAALVNSLNALAQTLGGAEFGQFKEIENAGNATESPERRVEGSEALQRLFRKVDQKEVQVEKAVDVLEGMTSLLEVVSVDMIADAALRECLHVKSVEQRLKHGRSCKAIIQVVRGIDGAMREFTEKFWRVSAQIFAITRHPDCNRIAFYSCAEAFALLVSEDAIEMSLALRTVSSLLKVPGQRCVGITILGKMVEICQLRIVDEADPGLVEELIKDLKLVTEPQFDYDLNYIGDIMDWDLTSASQPPKVCPPDVKKRSSRSEKPAIPEGTTRAYARLIPGIQATIVDSPTEKDAVQALALHDRTQTVFCVTLTGLIKSWTQATGVSDSLANKGKAHISVDILQNKDTLLVAGGYSQTVVSYSIGSGKWSPMLTNGTELEPRKIEVARGLDGQGQALIIIAETLASQKYPVSLFDYRRVFEGTTSSMLAPLSLMMTHSKRVTCLSTNETGPSGRLVITGSEDKTIKLWDARAPTNFKTIYDHETTITSLDARDNLLVSADESGVVLVWDVRKLNPVASSSPPKKVTGSPTKVSIRKGCREAAVSVSSSSPLYILDTLQGTWTEVVQTHSEQKPYLDMVWNEGGTTLFCAGLDCRLDSYSVP